MDPADEKGVRLPPGTLERETREIYSPQEPFRMLLCLVLWNAQFGKYMCVYVT